ncbi:Zona pellucida domain-containing protein [Strongyloides ratti]|uniref:Zona pellucida domain-containing protein n=1 Tax=Strongyloides ratti TaxID=34506 RepID=A0A090N018_STRRB|nr:Zona pellucida domain-containing protein [Strongyloides ratti]CEF69910.1 Zona pellucida domain-containing protein [Strongyloides ratti]
MFNIVLSKWINRPYMNTSLWKKSESKLYSSHVYASKVKNYIENAVVLCDSNSIGIKLDIFNFNGGRIFPSRHDGIYKCISYYPKNSSTITYRLPLNASDCGVWNFKKSDKFLSVEYTITVIVSFHPQKLTEDDKLYNLKCVYNAMHQSLNALMEISTFSNKNLIHEEGIPDCHYSLHRNSIDGPSIGKVNIGEKVFHTWKCNNPAFAMKVYQCYVGDGSSRKYLIIDETGCSKDINILPDLIYSSSLNLVYSEAKVFKFAQSSQMHFSCLILLCPKVDPNCKKYIPPNCKNNKKNGRFRRAGIQNTMNEMIEGNYTIINDKKSIDNNNCKFWYYNKFLILSMIFNIITLFLLTVSIFYNWKHIFRGKVEINSVNRTIPNNRDT